MRIFTDIVMLPLSLLFFCMFRTALTQVIGIGNSVEPEVNSTQNISACCHVQGYRTVMGANPENAYFNPIKPKREVNILDTKNNPKINDRQEQELDLNDTKTDKVPDNKFKQQSSGPMTKFYDEMAQLSDRIKKATTLDEIYEIRMIIKDMRIKSRRRGRIFRAQMDPESGRIIIAVFVMLNVVFFGAYMMLIDSRKLKIAPDPLMFAGKNSYQTKRAYKSKSVPNTMMSWDSQPYEDQPFRNTRSACGARSLPNMRSTAVTSPTNPQTSYHQKAQGPSPSRQRHSRSSMF